MIGGEKVMPDKKNYIVHLSFMEMDAVTLPLKDHMEAEKIASDCMGRMCQVEKDKEEVTKTKAPQLYNLSALQEDAGQVLGYGSEQTKELAFSLYERNLLTNPATDSRYLPEEMGYTTEKLIRILSEEIPFLAGYSRKPAVRQMLDPGQLEKSHAILPIPAGKGWDALGIGVPERNLLYLVGARVLMAAAGPYIHESHKSQLTCNYHTFFIDASHTRQEGYREIEKRMEAYFKAGREEVKEKELEIYLGKVFGPCDTSIAVADAVI